MLTPAEIIIACWATMIIYWVISAFFVKRDASRLPMWRGWWLRAAVLWFGISWVITEVARHTSSHQFALVQLNYSLGTWAWAGALLTVLGVALAIWARVYLGSNWSPAPALKEGHELVTSEPYKLVRHPIYTGMLFAAFGSSFVTPWWFIGFVIITVMFVWRVFVEEKLMMQQFPSQYPDYKKHTWALIPWVW